MDSKLQLGGEWLKPSTWFANNTARNEKNIQEKATLLTQRKEQETIRDGAIDKINIINNQISGIRTRGGKKSRKSNRKSNKKYSRKNH
jgi:hypothetical protein